MVTVEAESAISRADGAIDFVYVGSDADIEIAVAGAAAIRLYNTGQREGQSARIHIAAPLAYRFADRLHEYLAFLEVGDPAKSVTDLGPLYSGTALGRAIEAVSQALKGGALVKLGGRQFQPWGLTGYFLQPTLLVEGQGAERAPAESISGPVIIVSPTTDLGSALRGGVGITGSQLRVTALTRQPEKLERSLRAAAFRPRAADYTSLTDRAWRSARISGMDDNGPGVTDHTVEIELIGQRQADWFPYRNRRGMKL